MASLLVIWPIIVEEKWFSLVGDSSSMLIREMTLNVFFSLDRIHVGRMHPIGVSTAQRRLYLLCLLQSIRWTCCWCCASDYCSLRDWNGLMLLMLDRTVACIVEISLSVSDRIASYLWSPINRIGVPVRFACPTAWILHQELEDHARCCHYPIDRHRCPLLVRVDQWSFDHAFSFPFD